MLVVSGDKLDFFLHLFQQLQKSSVVAKYEIFLYFNVRHLLLLMSALMLNEWRFSGLQSQVYFSKSLSSNSRITFASKTVLVYVDSLQY